MDGPARLIAFEQMLSAILTEQDDTSARMAALKAQGREKTVTYRQLLVTKLELMNLLSRYRRFGLLETASRTEP